MQQPSQGSAIRIGLVGLGRAGWGMHYQELTNKSDKFTIIAAYDSMESRRSLAEEHGIRAFRSYEELLADPELELIDIATRSCDHYEHGLMALRAGKDILMEKPLTLQYEEALKLYMEAKRAGKSIYVRHNRRFDRDFLHVREIIASGILGEVFHIRLNRHSYQRRDDWQTLKAYGGGQLLNWGPHIIDHALCLLESPVRDIWSNLKHVVAAGDAEDHIKIIMTGENERIVDLEISGGLAIGLPVYMVHGTRGSLSLTGKKIHLRYLDPSVPFQDLKASDKTPGAEFGSSGTYESQEKLIWIDETIPVAPAQTMDLWDELYAAIRLGHMYPIRKEEALEVVRIISEVKKGTLF